jgi:hypothetical protein
MCLSSVLASCQDEANQTDQALATLAKAIKLLSTPNAVFSPAFKERLLRLQVYCHPYSEIRRIVLLTTWLAYAIFFFNFCICLFIYYSFIYLLQMHINRTNRKNMDAVVAEQEKTEWFPGSKTLAQLQLVRSGLIPAPEIATYLQGVYMCVCHHHLFYLL